MQFTLFPRAHLGLVPADQPDAAAVWPVDVPESSRCGANDAHVHCVIKRCTDRRPIQHDLLLQHHHGPT